MSLSKLSSKTVGVIFAGVGLTIGAAIYYFSYVKHRRSQLDDADEGIGDVDSIISEEEIEEGSLSRVPSDLKSQVESSIRSKESCSSDAFENKDTAVEDAATTKPVQSVKVLVLGLEKCGKTSMLNLLSNNSNSDPYLATTGFNAVQVEKDNFALSIVEVGGSEPTMSYWKNFTNETSLLIYMIDGSNPSLYNKAKNALKSLLAEAATENMACLLISNKQDVVGAQKISEIFSERDLQDLGNNGCDNITLMNSVCVMKDDGTSDCDVIMQLILSILKERYGTV